MLKHVHFDYIDFLRPSQQLWPVWNPGERLAGLTKGTTRQCYILNIGAVGLMIEKIFPKYKSIEANEPQAWPNKAKIPIHMFPVYEGSIHCLLICSGRYALVL